MSARSVESALKKLEKLDEVARAIHNKAVRNNERVREATEKVRKEQLSIRITKVTPEVIKFREKVLKNKTIAGIMKDHKISIEEVGLARLLMEEVKRKNFITWEKESNCYRVRYLMSPTGNSWEISVRYEFGGPSDRLRVFFDNPDTTDFRRYQILGVMANFPLR